MTLRTAAAFSTASARTLKVRCEGFSPRFPLTTMPPALAIDSSLADNFGKTTAYGLSAVTTIVSPPMETLSKAILLTRPR